MRVAQLILPLIFGFAGYRRALWFEGKYGRTPWGWNPWGWGVLFFLGFVIGLIPLAFAERSGRRDAEERAFQSMRTGIPNGGAPHGQWPSAPSGGRRI
jgi:hypothetical protein